MYNRYIPDPNGGYRRMEIEPEPCREQVCPAAAAEEKNNVMKQQSRKGGFDTDDLLILLILLLLLLDGEENDRVSVLAALAAFILL